MSTIANTGPSAHSEICTSLLLMITRNHASHRSHLSKGVIEVNEERRKNGNLNSV